MLTSNNSVPHLSIVNCTKTNCLYDLR